MFSFLGSKSHLLFFRLNPTKNASTGSGSALGNFDGVCSVMQLAEFPSNL